MITRKPEPALWSPVEIEAAMRRAADRARHVAIQTGTPLVFWRDGKVVQVDPHTVPLCSPDDPPGQPIPPSLV
jgi:hypothetical protein